MKREDNREQARRRYVWVLYSKVPPYLPVAVAETVWELSQKTGMREGSIMSMWSQYRRGKKKLCRVAKVEV